jgi:NADP-dependent 3-hydroxy acid dehydrogenase YdfG
MKKMAITGHTYGIGKGIADFYANKGWEIRGFCRENGYDLKEPENLQRVVDESLDCDVFINNAFSSLNGFGQTYILRKIFPHWKDTPKWIFNISSVASDFTAGRQEIDVYATFKLALDEYSKQLTWQLPRVNIVLIRPGMVDTQRIAHRPGRKLRVDDIVNTIDWVLTQPEDVHISEVTVRVKDPDKYV